MRRSFLRAFKARQSTSYDPTLFFEQVQVGTVFHHNAAKNFALKYFSDKLQDRGITEGKVQSMDPRSLTELVRSLLFERYVSVPFSVFAFDLEFTGLPGQKNAPASIIEVGLYCPDTKAEFSSLVRPLSGTSLTAEAAKLTKITPAELEAAPTFDQVWRDVITFISENAPDKESSERALLLSHGGKLADINMIQDSCKVFDLTLPPSIKFGDTYNAIKDLHRKRPVTKDKHPPSWALSDIAFWLNLDVPPVIHRALPDAKLTWDVMYHTLDRYGDSGLTPRQQLVSRYYAECGENLLQSLGRAPRPSPVESAAFESDADLA